MLAHDAEAVQCSAEGERFEAFAVDTGCADTFHKVVDVLERAVCTAFLYDGRCGIFPYAFYGCEAEAYLSVLVHAEIHERFVDVGTLCRHAESLALVHEFRDFPDVVAPPRHDGSHELRCVVGFEICCLVCHP